MHIVSWVLGGVGLQECGLPARNAAQDGRGPRRQEQEKSPSPKGRKGEVRAKGSASRQTRSGAVPVLMFLGQPFIKHCSVFIFLRMGWGGLRSEFNEINNLLNRRNLLSSVSILSRLSGEHTQSECGAQVPWRSGSVAV